MNRRRVVITGLGCVTALSESVDELFAALCEGKSGVSTIESFDTSQFPVHFGGEIKQFDVTKYIDKRDAKRMDRFAQFAIAGAVSAVRDSGLDFSKEDPYRVAVIVGTGIGGIKEIEEQHIRLLEKGPGKVSPFCVPRLMSNAASGNIAIQFGVRGPCFAVSSACASGNHTIGEAFWNIASNRSDVAITGGSEAALTPIGLGSFCAARSLSLRNDNPPLASRPFDRDRDGFVLTEGAGILVLEEYEHARKRGATIYAELLGYGATDDGYHITAPLPDGEGAAMAMKLAMADAKVNPEDVGYINAHGTSTELNDIAESTAIKTVFGRHAYKVPVSSTKSCLGHMLGATAAVELIAAIKAINCSVIPPTINLDNLDERCDPKMDYVPWTAREAEVNIAISNSFGFGGHNACLVVGKV
ncbi:MAG TPA: beta-ketoacyl-ACP synthase II [Sedimentisphaerales bacterium]|nr:beta-ketoacyl-ACP synthase II [Sedimentisphaerales bacterium]HRS10972.1 beta-ketoacyl-ACP synthase II [Sedimentisphaerales bacterium]HRV48666.1 beta-ketoacyl-ACP synthase II [Sedimentisphaerales bacterium]